MNGGSGSKHWYINMEKDIYAGVFYCSRCYAGLHIVRILKERRCRECGNRVFISGRDLEVESVHKKFLEEGEYL